MPPPARDDHDSRWGFPTGTLGAWGRTLANMGVVGIVCWLLMDSQRHIYDELKESRRTSLEALKESRQEYRQDLSEMRKRYESIRTDHIKMLLMLEEIHRQVTGKVK